MKNYKKIICVLLSAVILFSVFSITGFNAFANIEKGFADADIYTGFKAPDVSFYSESKPNLDYIEENYSGAMKALSSGFDNHKSYISLERFNLTLDELNNIFMYLKYYKLYYYVDAGYYYGLNPDGIIVYCSPEYYMDKKAVEKGNEIINEKVNAIVYAAAELKTDIEKIIYVHNYIVGSFEYYNESTDQRYNNIYNGLVYNTTMCVGYSETFNYIMECLGIKSYIVTSNDNEHAWNMVFLDGNYYHVDCTWDDPTYLNPNLLTNPVSGNYLYNNLMCSDSVMEYNEHISKDWSVNGYNIYGYADSKVYDDFFWRNADGLIPYSEGCWYLAAAKDSNTLDDAGFTISEVKFTDNVTYTVKQIRNIFTFYALPDNQGYLIFYPNLQVAGDFVYYKTANGIYLLNKDSATDTEIFKSEKKDKNIYDFVLNSEEHTFSVAYGVYYTDAV